MIKYNESACPKCFGGLKYYDTVQRVVRTKGRVTSYVELRRFRCVICRAVHRELPDYLLPYKQYEMEVIKGILEGLITSDTLGYEDYPCSRTMNRWSTQNLQAIL